MLVALGMLEPAVVEPTLGPEIRTGVEWRAGVAPHEGPAHRVDVVVDRTQLPVAISAEATLEELADAGIAAVDVLVGMEPLQRGEGLTVRCGSDAHRGHSRDGIIEADQGGVGARPSQELDAHGDPSGTLGGEAYRHRR